jgi:peptide/nickel transport system permease protein
MLRYAAGRIVLTVPVLFGVSLMSFAIIHLIPGDIVSVLAGPMVAPDSEAAQNIRRALHLDQPLPVQYGLWLIGALHGDFGNSLVMGLPVGPQIASHLPVTLVLTALSLFFAIMIGLPAGVTAATARGRWPDLAIRGVALLGLSTPPFFVGVATVLLLSIYLPSFKTLGAVDLHHDPLGGVQTLLLPAFVLRCFRHDDIATRASPCSRCWRSLTVTARAKGAGRLRVLIRHGLRNALLPVRPRRCHRRPPHCRCGRGRTGSGRPALAS